MLQACTSLACPPGARSGKREVALGLLVWYVAMTTLAVVWLAVTRDVTTFGAFMGLWVVVTGIVTTALLGAYGLDAYAKQVIPAQQAGAP